MARFAYRARDASGKPVKGFMEAKERGEVIDKLSRMGYMATYAGEAGSGAKLESLIEVLGLRRVSSDDLLLFYVQFSNLISAGITILMSLHTLKNQIEKRALSDIVNEVSRSIEGGESLSQALAGYPKVFPRLFINMVKAGEASGKLDNVLLKYAAFYERQENLKRNVKSALVYPVILLCAGVAVTLFIVTFIIPQFAQIYLEAGIRLPAPTLIVYKTGMAIKHYWYIMALLIVIISAGVKYYLLTPKGRLIFDNLKLRAPVLGPLYRKAAIARFSRTLATLAGSGVPILESLDITKDVMDNEVLAGVILNVRGCVEKGERIAAHLKVSNEFPQDVAQMVSIGEETGRLDEMLNKVADFYDIYVEYNVKKITTFIEPFFLVVMGVMVGFIMASMLMPIFDMIKTLKH